MALNMNTWREEIYESVLKDYIISFCFWLYWFFLEPKSEYKINKKSQLLWSVRHIFWFAHEYLNTNIDYKKFLDFLNEFDLASVLSVSELNSDIVEAFQTELRRYDHPEEQLQYYESQYDWNYDNLRRIPQNAIERFLLWPGKYNKLYPNLSKDEIRNKINVDIWILDVISMEEYIKIEKKVALSEKIINTFVPWTWEFIEQIELFKDLLEQSIQQCMNLNLETSLYLDKFHYYCMLYDMNYFFYFWKTRESWDAKNKIKTRWMKIIEDILHPFWAKYWIHNDAFLNKVAIAKYIKYMVELIYLYCGWEKINQKWYIYLNWIQLGIIETNRAKLLNIYYLVCSKFYLKHLWFGIKHWDGNIFEKLNDKFDQIVRNEWDSWMVERLEEHEEFDIDAENEKIKDNVHRQLCDDINKWEWISREYKASFCINPARLVNEQKSFWERMSHWWQYSWLEAIVQFLNTDWWELIVGIWERKNFKDHEKLSDAHAKWLVILDDHIPEYIIIWIDNDLKFENVNFDQLVGKIETSISQFITTDPFKNWDSIIIEQIKFWDKTLCKIKIPRGEKYYHLKREIEDKNWKIHTIHDFLIRKNHGKVLLNRSEEDEYRKSNPR